MEMVALLVLPFVLILARVAAFITTAPLFGSGNVPAVVKVGLVLLLTLSFAFLVPGALLFPTTHWLKAMVLVVQETAIGLALGLAARMLYGTVQQAGTVLAQQMGLTDAEVIDPVSGEESESVATFMETTFALMFLAAGGHLLLIALLFGSYRAMPAGGGLNIEVLAQGLVSAGSMMLMLALKLAAPALAAFLVLAVVFALLSRMLPDMNILFESYPLRIALGLTVAVAMLPSLSSFTGELAQLINRAFGG